MIRLLLENADLRDSIKGLLVARKVVEETSERKERTATKMKRSMPPKSS